MPRIKISRGSDITGRKFGKLTAVERVGTDKHRKAVWLFLCECGNTKTVAAEYLCRDQNKVKSCGCLRAKQHTGLMAVVNQVFGHHYNDGNLTIEQFYQLTQQECHYCGAPPSNHWTSKKGRKRLKEGHVFIYNGLDRLDSSKSHNLDNVLPCCWTCNRMKSDMHYDNFVKWIELVHQRIGNRSGNRLTSQPSNLAIA